jgi:GNAT superfamily N-acetyltransferase
VDIDVRKTEFSEIEPLRWLYRQEANCQIVRDSILSRGLADPYLILIDGRVAGYAGVWNRYNPGRVMEFYTLPCVRAYALQIFREMLAATSATEIEAQTNLPLQLLMLYDCAANIAAETTLFADALTTRLECQTGTFRKLLSEEQSGVFHHRDEPVGDWAIESGGEVVATGGALYHYNPPYGDIYMEVAEHARNRGFGSYLVQELKRVTYEAGKRPSARCDVTNMASRRTLQKAGFLPCAHILVGTVKQFALSHSGPDGSDGIPL